MIDKIRPFVTTLFIVALTSAVLASQPEKDIPLADFEGEDYGEWKVGRGDGVGDG